VIRAFLVALGFLLLPGVVAGQNEEPRGRSEITGIQFVGNRTFSTDSLKRAIVNRATECRTAFLKPLCAAGVDFALDRHYFNFAEFARDAVRLQLYYWQRGYREAVVDTASDVPAMGRIELTLRVTEGRPVLVDSIAVVGGEDIEDLSLLGSLPLSEGDPLSWIAVEATRDLLESSLHDAGYAYALVLLRTELPIRSYSAAVTFDVDPGSRVRFGKIDILGNRELSEDVVRRMIGFSEGDRYGASTILDAQRNLFNLEIVQYARVDTLPTADLDTIIPLRIEISEGDEFRVRAGAGWSTAECLATEARWTARNFIGGARRFQVRGRLSNVLAESLQDPFCSQAGVGLFGRLNWLVAADFSQPWIFSPRNSLAVELYGERTSLSDVFVRKAVGVNLVLVRSLARNTSLSMSYRPQLSRLEAAEVFFCTSFLACAPSDIAIVQGANWIAPVGAGLSTIRTDNLLNPRSGYGGAVDLEHASRLTGSNYSYNRVLAEISLYRGVGGSGVVASRLEVGWVSPGEFALLRGNGFGRKVVHPQKRFFAGGSNSVRGFAQNRLGPKVLTVSVERLLLPDPTTGQQVPLCSVEEVVSLVCDAGGLAPGDFTPQPTGGTRVIEGNLEYRFPLTARALEGVTFVDFGQVWAEGQEARLDDVIWTPGLGVRYYSTIGPIRLDLGYRATGGERLQVVTSQVEPCVPGGGGKACREIAPGAGFVRAGELAVLHPSVPFEEDLSFLQRLQFQFSIGQSF
jgi:outer membrane protein insertion porin family